MNETRIYADAFETTFANTKEMLEFLAERAKASRWIRKYILMSIQNMKAIRTEIRAGSEDLKVISIITI